MDPRSSAQDVMRCHLCETTVVQMHCDVCLFNLCKTCVGEHIISDETKNHKIVKFTSRRSTPLYPECKSHEKERSRMYCKECDIPVCSVCIASEIHTGHKILQTLSVFSSKREEIQNTEDEIKESIYPTYQDIASDAQNKKRLQEKEFADLTSVITKHGQYLHKEVDNIVNKLKTKVKGIKAAHHLALERHISEINQRISYIDEELQVLTELLESNDISQVFQFRSKAIEYRKLPCKVVAPTPYFAPLICQQEKLMSLFGKLSTPSITSEDFGYSMKKSKKMAGAKSSPSAKQLLGVQNNIINLKTETENPSNLVCQSDVKIWISGKDGFIKLFQVNQGKRHRSIITKSGNEPAGIAVTNSGHLVYNDYIDRTVNIVMNKKTKDVIRLQNWIPKNICSTSDGDLLISMKSDELKQSKVLRFSGSTYAQKQTIQFADKSRPLFSFSPFFTYMHITENRNLDIVVSDSRAKAVVVVNQAGKLRFRYTGQTLAPTNQPFNPVGITTDSQSHILTADYNNDCVHIVDQDGQFLRYIVSKAYGTVYRCE